MPGETARARDGERGAAQLLRRERVGARAGDEALHLGVELLPAQPVAAADDRHDEPAVRLNREPEVVAVEEHDLLALEARVELGEAREGERGRAQEERDERAAAARVLERIDPALVDPRDGGNGLRARQVLRDLAAHAAERLASSLARRRRGAADVALGDLAARAAAAQPVERHAELLGQAAHSRQRAGALRRDGLGRGASVLDHHEERPDRDCLAGADEERPDPPRRRRGDLHRRLVGLHLEERLVLRDHVPFRHEPRADLPVGQALAEVGELQLVAHASNLRQASRTRGTDGM